MIVPQLASGGCTPIERNESAASVSMAIAIMSGKKTITVVITFGQDLAPEQPPVRRAEPDRGLDELAAARSESTSPRIGRATYGM